MDQNARYGLQNPFWTIKSMKSILDQKSFLDHKVNFLPMTFGLLPNNLFQTCLITLYDELDMFANINGSVDFATNFALICQARLGRTTLVLRIWQTLILHVNVD